jgi:hypothetical protein
LRPPEWHEVVQPEGWEHLPLHVKPVAPLNCDAVANLDVQDEEVRACFVRARKWIHDAGAYSLLPAGRQGQPLQPTRLSTEDIQRMLDAGQIEPIDPARAGLGESVRCSGGGESTATRD